jgi:hypothetical protein
LSKTQIGRWAGLAMVFDSAVDLAGAVVAERTNITGGNALWADGQVLAVAAEAAQGITRAWSSTGQHARTAVISAGVRLVLGADTSGMRFGAGLEADSSGANGDGYLATDLGWLYLRTGGAWAPASAVDVSANYLMPPPTGVASKDQAAIVAAMASPRGAVLCRHPGVYRTNAEWTWPSNKFLINTGADGAVVFKADDAATNDWQFRCATGATNFGGRGIVFDANYTARMPTGALCGIADCVFAPAGQKWFDCEFNDTGIGSGLVVSGDPALSVQRTKFTKALRSQMLLAGTDGSTLTDVEFRDYNRAATAPTYPALSLQTDGSTPTTNLSVRASRFFSLTSTGFAIEAVADVLGVFHTMSVTGCQFDSNNIGGGGISGPIANSVITGNRWTRGIHNARSGLELAGSGNTVTGNYLQSTANSQASNASPLIVLTAAMSGMNRRNKVLGNTLDISSSGVTNLQGIGLTHQFDSHADHNTISFTLSGTASVQAGIYLGTVGGPGPLRRARARRNTLTCTNTGSGSSGNAIRLLSGLGVGAAAGTDYAAGLTVMGNEAAGFNVGLMLPSTANDTKVTAVQNDLSGCATPISGTTSGAGNTINSIFP